MDHRTAVTRHMERIGWVIGLCLALGAPHSLAAQSRGTAAIQGQVVLESGEPISGASVRLRHEGTGAEYRTLTNPAGRFLFLVLQPGGPYTLSVQNLGYAEHVSSGIELAVGSTTPFQVVMTIQAIEVEGVQVQLERAGVFNPGRVGPTTLVTPELVERLPIMSRNLMELAALSPLVTSTEGGGFSVAGQNDRYNSILVDGVFAKDPFGLTAGGVPGGQSGARLLPYDAVAQYEVLVAPYDVRLSGFTGGVMNAVTRTGTNDWWSRGFVVGRNETFTGPLQSPLGSADASGTNRTVVGLSLGGPIVRDRVHFFLSGEFERSTRPPVGFNFGRDPGLLVRLNQERIDELTQTVFDLSGKDVGDAGTLALEQSLDNVFGRIDIQLAPGQRLTIRNIYAGATNDEGPNRLAFDPYGFSSNGVIRDAYSNSLSAELTSSLGSRSSNELTLLHQRGRDLSEATSDFPEIEIPLDASIDGRLVSREVRVGANFFAQDNALRQHQTRLTNTLSTVRGQTTFTGGVTLALYNFRQRYLPGAIGGFRFGSRGELVDNLPDNYEWGQLDPGQPDAVDFSVAEWGVFGQSELSAGKGLTLRFGVRVDVPHVLDTPERNWDAFNFFGYDTSNLPSGNPLISPRWSFNWQSTGERLTQVRGGAGLFTGQLPFVWLANAFHDNGLRWATRSCNTVPPEFDGTVRPACFDSQVVPDERELRNLTLFSSDFRYPQDFRISIGFDRELSERATFSGGVLYNRAMNQIVIQDLNLGAPTRGLGPLEGYGGLDRKFYGDASRSATAQFYPPFNPNKLDPRYDHVLLASNETDDWALALTAETDATFDAVHVKLGYTHTISRDRMSLVSTDMVSNYGFTPTGFDPNAQPLTPSNFERPHKMVASVEGAPFGPTGPVLSLLYIGQSGAPYSFVYEQDMNGDGYPGNGPAHDRLNDLVYVAERPAEIVSSPATQILMRRTFELECLADQVGRIMERNSCRAPWRNQLDVRASHEFPAVGGRLRLEADLINVLNLMNSSWGHAPTVRSVIPFTDLGRGPTRNEPTKITSRWSGGSYLDDEGNLLPTDAWNSATPASQWQLQLGARFTFGDGR